ncbi:hypothetical protein R50072_20820 [Simiduia litorea]
MTATQHNGLQLQFNKLVKSLAEAVLRRFQIIAATKDIARIEHGLIGARGIGKAMAQSIRSFYSTWPTFVSNDAGIALKAKKR